MEVPITRAPVACLAVLLAWPALASAQLSGHVVPLDDGLAVERLEEPCRAPHYRCYAWHPHGFRFGPHWWALSRAWAFALVASTGRIVAATPGVQPGRRYRGRMPPVILYTDDLGATWQQARWDWPHHPRALAFDRTSAFGVAAGEGGYVWNTHDGGTTWIDRGGSSGTTWTRVLVVGRACVLVDSRGGVWRSRDGGGARSLVVEDPNATVELADDAIEIGAGARRWRVRRDGNLEPR